MQKLYGRNIGGKSEVGWKFKGDEKKPGEAKYLFMATSFGCKEVKSGNIEQLKPEFTNLQWKDENSEGTASKAYTGDIVSINSEVKNIKQGEKVVLKIFEKDNGGENDFVEQFSVEVKENKINHKWTVIYVEDTDDSNSESGQGKNGHTLPEYIFTIETEDGICKSKNSPVLQIIDWFEVQLFDENEKALSNVKYTLKHEDGTERSGVTDFEGRIKEKEIAPGKFKVTTEKHEFYFDREQ
jgi:hypothetical protein